MRLPNLNALRMFDAAARHLNFQRAAKEVNLTQGAVAQQIRKLEADLGQKLFERQARGVSLTAVGVAYHKPIRKALALIEDASRDLLPDPGKVTISVAPSFAAKWLVPRLRGFSVTHPEIDLTITASDSVADFRSDGVDMAVRYVAKARDPALEYEDLSPLNLRAVCSVEYAEAIGEVNDISSLACHDLIEDSHCHWHRLLTEADIPVPKRVLQFNQTGLAMDAAMNGQGIALVPKLYLPESPALKTVWIPEMTDAAMFCIVWPKSASGGKAGTAVRLWLREAIAAS